MGARTVHRSDQGLAAPRRQCENPVDDSRITDVSCPVNTVTSLGNSVFTLCSALKNVIIPSSVTSIGTSCFSNALSLNGLILPTSIASIGASAFFSNDYMSLRVIYILATTPPSLNSSSLFKSDIVTIYVPYGTKSLYESDTNWSEYNGKFVELPA